MNKIILIRHGNATKYPDGLTGTGVQQIKALLVKIREHFSENKTIMVSSDAPRAIETAELLCHQLQLPLRLDRALWSDNNHRENAEIATRRIIDYAYEANAEVVIVITHFEYTSSLPNFLSQTLIGKNILPFSDCLQEGEMYILNLSQESYDIVESERLM